MKIAIVHPTEGCDRLQPSAPAILLHDLTQASSWRDQTRVFSGWTANPYDDLDIDILPQDIQHSCQEEAPLFAERIRAFGPDIVEVHLQLRWAIALARALPEMPVVYYRHNPSEPPLWISGLGRSLRYCHLAHMISVSDFAHQILIKRHPEHQERLSLVKNALASENWLAQDGAKEKIILFCGRAIPEKGIEQFVEAVANIMPEFADWRVVVLSGIPMTSRSGAFENMKNYGLRQKAALEKALSDQCLWITNASREQIQTWTKKAQISAVPSSCDEAFGLVLLEMHMAGCAVISSGRGGMKEVSGPDGALYLKEVSGDAIAEALRFLINNSQERSALAQRGHEYAMRHHNIQDRAAELDALRHQIVQRTQQERRTPKIWRRHVRREQLRVLKAKLFGA